MSECAPLQQSAEVAHMHSYGSVSLHAPELLQQSRTMYMCAGSTTANCRREAARGMDKTAATSWRMHSIISGERQGGDPSANRCVNGQHNSV